MTINRNHIDHIFSQKFSLHDQKKLEEYFEDESLNDSAKLIMKDQWNQFEADPDDEVDLNHVFHKLYYSISNDKNKTSKQRNLTFRISQIAAILVVGILIASSIYFSRNESTSINNHPISFVSHGNYRSQFTLPDGTSGWLGYNSTLNYQLDSLNKRSVDLVGLAYFDVVHNEDQPFVVNTPSNLQIEVLGTSFNVSSYDADQVYEIVLERGHVVLNAENGVITDMFPNERVLYNEQNGSFQKTIVDSKDYLAWTQGRLNLIDITIDESMPKISRFYNVDIDNRASGLDAMKIRLVLEDESLEETAKLLSLLLPIKYNIIERQVLEDNSFSKRKLIITNK